MEDNREKRERQQKNFFLYMGGKTLTGEWQGKHLIIITDWGDNWTQREYRIDAKCKARWSAFSNKYPSNGDGWGDNPDDAHEDLLRENPHLRGVSSQYL